MSIAAGRADPRNANGVVHIARLAVLTELESEMRTE